MSEAKPLVRWATAGDVDSFLGARPAQTVFAKVMEIDGRLIGIGGLAKVNGITYAFMNLEPEAKLHKKALVRAIKQFMAEMVETSRAPVFAKADDAEPTAPGLLEHFGFKKVTGEVYQWR